MSVALIGQAQTCGFGYPGRRTPTKEGAPPLLDLLRGVDRVRCAWASRRSLRRAPLLVTARSAGAWHHCGGDLEHEPEDRLRVQAVHAPECLRVDTAGDHLRPKVDPAAGEVHDEAGPSRFFHDRISNVGPVRQAGSKPSDSPLGAPAKGSVLRRHAPPDSRHPHPPKVPFRGSKRGVRVGVGVLFRGVRVGGGPRTDGG